MPIYKCWITLIIHPIQYKGFDTMTKTKKIESLLDSLKYEYGKKTGIKIGLAIAHKRYLR